MTDLYKCGSCGQSNLDYEWNVATKAYYGEDILEIGDCDLYDGVFICPSCGEEIDGERIALVEEVDEPSVEQSKGLREIPVKIKRLHPDAVIPQYATELAAGFDLVAVENVIIEPGETKLIPLGFAVEIPEGFEMQIRPRSGVTCKTKLRVGNSPGTCDADFRGEVKVIVDNIEPPIYEMSGKLAMTDVVVSMCGRNDDVTFAKTHCFPSGTHYIPKGTRIAQGIIAPIYRADFIVVDQLGETERGDGGFGSTGVKTGGGRMNERITLTSPVYEIVDIQRRTKAETMKDWKKGDLIRFSTVMEAMSGASGGGVYASMFSAENLTQGTSVFKSQTQLSGFFGLGTESYHDKYATFTIREAAQLT